MNTSRLRHFFLLRREGSSTKSTPLYSPGFTIVELLVVIVIIGILAALVVVAYNGMQIRAQNAQTISAVQAWKKALIQYVTEKGQYPSTPHFTGACLGVGYEDGMCWQNNTTFIERPSFNSDIAPYFNSSLPNPYLASIGSPARSGAIFYRHTDVTVDGVSSPYLMMYVVQGQSCPVGPILLAAPWPTLTTSTSSGGYTTQRGGAVECWLALPRPSDL